MISLWEGSTLRFETLAEWGILTGTECGPAEFCPNEPIQRWVMAAFRYPKPSIGGKGPGPMNSHTTLGCWTFIPITQPPINLPLLPGATNGFLPDSG